ncbi:V-set and immunoglobulin domain-containing protein 10 isoform X4 [Vulpes vulpes]|uniref:V-set and immunoglobulin domain-containing protein 10 isoform X4 n=1 Tax=Vulpes vulpes TaxID=9627 RepID=UPI003B97ABF5
MAALASVLSTGKPWRAPGEPQESPGRAKRGRRGDLEGTWLRQPRSSPRLRQGERRGGEAAGGPGPGPGPGPSCGSCTALPARLSPRLRAAVPGGGSARDRPPRPTPGRAGLGSARPGARPLHKALLPGQGFEALVIGEVHENITLRCGNVSRPRGPVTWYRNDSEPVFLLSSNSSIPPAEPRFSLANASSLHIKVLRPQDEGNYTCREVLNETRWFRVWLQMARSPSLLSEPMKTCFVGGNVTLTCQVSGAYPLAKILWLRNLTQPEVVIRPNGHYLITQDGQSSTLTIRNCSQVVDEGYYVCRAENPVGVREVDIWLSVKEPLNIGGIVGTIVSLLLLGLAIISGLMLYYSPVFCWKVGNTFRGQDMGDVMVLVDSEEEEVEEENAAEEEEEEEEEANEGEESPEEIPKHGHIHRVTALVNGNVDWMANGLQALQDNSSEEQSDIIQEEDRPV